uniref:Uncharacterized protein n=1 Tax=Meloidogyne incognita TaxID=6306 RepID=A0A914M0S3_MELIC
MQCLSHGKIATKIPYNSLLVNYVNKRTILFERISADWNPCDESITSAISPLSGAVIANERKSCFKLSGRFERPEYPGFIVIKIAIFSLTFLELLGSVERLQKACVPPID